MTRKSGVRKKQAHLDAESLALLRLAETKRYDEIAAAARQRLGRQPGNPVAAKVLSFALLGLGRYEEALPILRVLAKAQAHDPEIHNNLAIALNVLLRWDESIASFKRALELAPNDPETLKNIGAAYVAEKRWNDAVPWLLKAIECHPGDYIEAVRELASCLANAHRTEEAATCFGELWNAEPTDAWALYGLMSARKHGCDWRNSDTHTAELRNVSDAFAKHVGSPFIAFALPDLAGIDYRRLAESHARNAISPFVYRSGSDHPVFHKSDASQLRVGYLSSDFRAHPVGQVVSEVLERHDRSRVKIYAYSMGPDDGSVVRARIAAAADSFVDVAMEPIPDTLQRIRQDKIDVLVDLNGWTAEGRPEILALRAAPVQVNWLGYAGTMGHPQLADYILGDAVVTPLDHAAAYTETIAQLPFCYLPADTTRELGPAVTRSSQGLPEDALVFCSFNNAYKFNPAVFDVWSCVLNAVPNSVLWLPFHSQLITERLRSEIATRGLDPNRLVFARRTDTREEHIARIQLADIALDTFPYNSHSTGIDALWAGVPMVALLGEGFASRVGASLLHAAGLGDLVAGSVKEYEAIALDLAVDEQKRQQYRRHLVDGRRSLPLFDMAKFARSLEDIYSRMFEQYRKGERTAIAASQPGET